MGKKGWRSAEIDGEYMVVASQSLYVFTRNELVDFTEAKMKDKLIEMSERENTPEDVRKWLLILSERV